MGPTSQGLNGSESPSDIILLETFPLMRFGEGNGSSYFIFFMLILVIRFFTVFLPGFYYMVLIFYMNDEEQRPAFM